MYIPVLLSLNKKPQSQELNSCTEELVGKGHEISHDTLKSRACSNYKYMHNLLDKPPVPYPLSNKMTAPNFLFTCVIVFFWSLLLSSFHAIPAYPTDDSLKVSATYSQKVNLSLYYDTLCPFCATFIVKNLTGVFYEDLINIINLRLVPWGNSYINKSSNSIVCQVTYSHPHFGFY